MVSYKHLSSSVGREVHFHISIVSDSIGFDDLRIAPHEILKLKGLAEQHIRNLTMVKKPKPICIGLTGSDNKINAIWLVRLIFLENSVSDLLSRPIRIILVYNSLTT
jgi:hypothetical protein